jgi:hypothetical protein
MLSSRLRLLVPFVILAALFLPFAVSASAQWSPDPSENLPIADRSGEQVQPKVRETPDGGCYVSWFDNASGGYDVYLQRLDADGVEQWAHDGVLVADRSFSSTQDYDLVVDGDGNAILVYRDDRSVGEQIGANKITPDGTLAWGTNGVLLTSTSAFVATPSAAVTSDGSCVFGWTQDSGFVLQKLDADGAPQWGSGVSLAPDSGSYILSDLEPSDAGSVIALWVRPVGSIFTDKHLYTQKFDASGTTLWGTSPVIVYDGGSVQMGYFPRFVTDGAGGAVFGWYEVSGARHAYVQRIDSSGDEVFSHNGVPVSTLAGRIQLSPWVAYDSTTEESFLFWTESNTQQTLWGVYGQKISPAGARQWSDSGRELIPLGSQQTSFVRAEASGEGGAVVACFDRSGPAKVLAMKLDGAGDFVWPGSIVEACSLLSGKSRLDLDLRGDGTSLLVWSDARDDSGDVYAQNVNADGSLGAAAAVSACGVGAVHAGCGPVEDVLFANGQNGGAGRTVTILATDPIVLTIQEPTSRRGDGEPSDACVYAWLGEPGAQDVVSVPKGLGTMCFGPWIVATKTPKKIWNAIGHPTKLGADNAPGPEPSIPDLGGFDLLARPGGLGRVVTVTLQGLVEDDCSQGTVPFSVTNGLVLRVE